MEATVLKATPRSDRGKGVARRLRRADLIPGVVYGGKEEPIAISLSPKALKEVLTGTYGSNALIKLEIEGGASVDSLIAEYQYHPLSRALLHVDFRRVNVNEEGDYSVPFELKGRPKGVVLGGDLRQVYRTLPVRCLPTLVPEKIVHDITELGLDEVLAVKELSLPEGVSIRYPESRTVALIVAGRKAKAAEEEAAAPANPKKK